MYISISELKRRIASISILIFSLTTVLVTIALVIQSKFMLLGVVLPIVVLVPLLFTLGITFKFCTWKEIAILFLLHVGVLLLGFALTIIIIKELL